MKLHVSTYRQNAKNTDYKLEVDISGLKDLKSAVRFDHMANRTTNDSRATAEQFIETDCIMLDLDNTHSEDPAEWKTLDDICDAFPDVEFYAIQSRNHMKVKEKTNSKTKQVIYYAARPKYHLYFPISGPVEYETFQRLILTAGALFYYVDFGAVDGKRFFYGVEHPEGEYIQGDLTLDKYLDTVPHDVIIANVKEYAGKIRSGEIELDDDGKKATNKLFEYFGVNQAATPTNKPQPAEDMPEGLEWLESVEQGKSEKWLLDWADQNKVELGRKYQIPKNSVSHPGGIAYCVICPWEDNHSENSESDSATVIIIDLDGRINFLCRHGHCVGVHSWKDYRAEMERRRNEEITAGWKQHRASAAGIDPAELEELKKSVKNEIIEINTLKAFQYWRSGAAFTEQQTEWLNNNTDFKVYDNATEFFTTAGLLDENGDPTEYGQAVIAADTDEQLIEARAVMLLKWRDSLESAGEAPGSAETATGEENTADDGNGAAEAGNALQSAADYLLAGNYETDIEYFRSYQDRKTGIHPDIDKYLTLYPGLAFLGGASSLGKTTFAVNLIDSLLTRGETVLFFTLEQLPIEIITKSLARGLYNKDPYTPLTNIDIKNGATSDDLEQVKREFAETHGNYYIYTGDFRLTAAGIAKYVEQFIKIHNVKPIVIIDYLQLIAPPEGLRASVREYTDENIKILKDLQKNNGLFMLVISSFNRSSNMEPVSYESFKETSMIEFTADYVFGLQLALLDPNREPSFYTKTGPNDGRSARLDNEKRQLLHDAQAQNPKQVQFVSLKNRNGKQFFTAEFDYYPQYDAYTPAQEFKQIHEISPFENDYLPII